MKQYSFMRACFGLAVSAAIGVVTALLTRPEPESKQRGLVWSSYRNDETPTSLRRADAQPKRLAADRDDGELSEVTLSRDVADALELDVGAPIYISDRRWWLGGLYAGHAVVAAIDDTRGYVAMGPALYESIVAPGRDTVALSVERETRQRADDGSVAAATR
jgi:hypothetical protein